MTIAAMEPTQAVAGKKTPSFVYTDFDAHRAHHKISACLKFVCDKPRGHLHTNALADHFSLFT